MIIKILSYSFLFGFGWFLGWVVVGTLFSPETNRQFKYPSEEPQLKNNEDEMRKRFEELKKKYDKERNYQ